jgi:hypothetical protein
VRKILVIELIVLALALALLGWPGIAQGQENIAFGIGPARADPENPETLAYFVHTLSPGAALTDEARIQNSGDAAIVLRLYAADALSSIGGGPGFAHEGQELNGGRHWVSPAMAEVSLGPGEEALVPFTIEVPPDASPGEHTAGLVVEAAPSEETLLAGQAPPTGEDDVAFVVRVVARSAVAVLVEVPGPRVAALEITDVVMREQDEQGADFRVYVRNLGNIRVRGEGFLVIRDRDGRELASVPTTMGSVLPGDTTYVNVRHPDNLADGDYLLGARLGYQATRGDEVGEAAFMEGVELKVKDGQPEVREVPEEGEPSEGTTQILILGLPEEEEVLPIGRYVAVGAVLLALVVTGGGLILWRRRTRARRFSP